MATRAAEWERALRQADNGAEPLRDVFIRLFLEADTRLAGIEGTASSVAALQVLMTQDANTLVNAVVTPLLAQIRAAADMGVLFSATSVSETAIGTGVKTFTIPVGMRTAFAPAAQLAIVAADDPAKAMWARKLAYDRETGVLTVDVYSTQGAGTVSSWSITAGIAASMAAHVAVAATGLVPLGNLQGALAAISAALANDPNFGAGVIAALASRYTKAETDALLAGRQAATAASALLAGLTPAGDQLPYFSAGDAAALTPLSGFWRSALGAADDAAARALLKAAAAHNPSITGNLRFGARAPVDGIFYAGAATSRVFVYDTRIDTDSGRWRSRGQGTRAFTTPASADRGARRDFPAIAVIAYDTANRARIFDAEAVAASGVPELWANVAMPTSGTVRQIKALNGVLCAAASNGLSVYDLLSDVRSKFDATGVTTYPGSAAGGLVAYTTSSTDAARAIVSTDVKGVDMRALPGAPVGFGLLPIPTIALATAAGASVLLASGAVVDITRTGGYVAVDFVSDTQLKLVTPEGDVELGPIPTADIANTAWRTSVRTPAFGAPTRVAGPAEATPRGLSMRYPNPADDAASLSAHIGPAFNTGWMPANVRRALFCDNVLGARTAATPLADDCTSTTGWTLGAGWTLDTGEFDHASGTAALDRALSGLTAGVRYRVRFLVGNRSAGSLSVSLLTASDEAGALSVAANGEHVVGFTATAATDTLRFTPTTDFNGSIQDVRVEVSIADRGPAGRDARVNGTLTLSTGVGEISHAVSWGAANFVDDGYTADLDFAGDFCVSFNLFSGPGDATIVQRGSAPASGARWEISVTQDAGVYYWTFSISDGAASASVTAILGTLSDRLHMAFVRRGATIEIWRGGALAASAAAVVGSLANALAGIRYGARVDGSRPMISFTQLKSLVIAASAPTADQIAEMARQDRTISQANALCCLGGGTAAVTAIDYDPITEQVAAAATGVSTFRGMLRTSYVSSLNSQMANNALLDVAIAGATIATASPAGGFCYRSELAAVMVESGGVGGAPAIHSHDPATPALPGFMSAADKAKLDAITSFSMTLLDETSLPAWLAALGLGDGVHAIVTVGDGQLVSGKYTVLAADMHKVHIFNTTVAAACVFPTGIPQGATFAVVRRMVPDLTLEAGAGATLGFLYVGDTKVARQHGVVTVHNYYGTATWQALEGTA
jgi:hypothetical protein